MPKRILQPLLPALLLGFLVAGCNDRGEQARRSANNTNQTSATSGQSGSNEQLAKDDLITTGVQSKLFIDRAVKGSQIDVSTKDDVVTLKGTVPSQQAKQEAVKQAQDVKGVSRVDDQLQVASQQPAPAATSGSGNPKAGNESNQQPGNQQSANQQNEQPPAQDDNTITTRVEAKYFTNPSITNREISVETANGTVTLKGDVQSETERQQAISIAKSVPGVKSVNDQLQINQQLQPVGHQLPAVSPVPQEGSGAVGTSGNGNASANPSSAQPDDAAIRTKIESLFFENDALRNTKIAVASSDGVVTLSGTATDPAAKQQAVQIAGSVSGVRRVVDQIGVQ